MLFNSVEFLFVFLPITWIGYHLLRQLNQSVMAMLWLVLASLAFYAYWNPSYVLLILISILTNHYLGLTLAQSKTQINRQRLFWLGIAFNLGLLGYYKYTHFLMDNLNAVYDFGMTFQTIILPLGISFFTFQQITLLVDIHYSRQVKDPGLLNYCLFVTFFPQLIAGPIVHHKEMMPQFHQPKPSSPWPDLTIGLTIFTLGLAKKVLIADTMALTSTSLFKQAASGYYSPGMVETWGAVICYTFQLYFDFSGYSDMAVGLGRMFGIRIPINFASPYKALSMIDFWRRWHITLSRLIMDYLYTPITMYFMRFSLMQEHGPIKFFFFTMALPSIFTFLLAGLWHGAGWNFILFGAIHGFALTINQLWRKFRIPIPKPVGWFLTMLAVMISFVPFRADNAKAIEIIYHGMMGSHGIALPSAFNFLEHLPETWLSFLGVTMNGLEPHYESFSLIFIPILLIAVLKLPNTMEWMRRTHPGLASKQYPATKIDPDGAGLFWRPTPIIAVATALLFTACLVKLNDVSEFIYFQF